MLEVGLALGREDAVHERGGQPQNLVAVRRCSGWLGVVIRWRGHNNELFLNGILGLES